MNKTWNDPIVEEVRHVRREHAQHFGFDLKAIFADLRRGQEEERRKGRTVMSSQAKRRNQVDAPLPRRDAAKRK